MKEFIQISKEKFEFLTTFIGKTDIFVGLQGISLPTIPLRNATVIAFDFILCSNQTLIGKMLYVCRLGFPEKPPSATKSTYEFLIKYNTTKMNLIENNSKLEIKVVKNQLKSSLKCFVCLG